MKSVIIGTTALAIILVIVMVGLFPSSELDPVTPEAKPSSECLAEPRELPSGADPGQVRFERDLRVWGDGADRVALLPEISEDTESWFESSDLPAGHRQRVSVRGNDGVVIPVGDPPLSQINFAWRDGPCDYTVWVGPGLKLKDAIDYASRF